MATWDGPAQSGGRIEYVYTVGSVSQSTTSVTVSVTAYLRMLNNNRSVGSWPQSWSGAWGSGSSTPYYDIPRNGRVEIRSWSGSVSLTDSTQSRAFQISAQHAFGTTGATLNVSIPARYARTPTGLTVERTSDSRAVIRWTRQGTYSSVGVQFRHNTDGSWGSWTGAGTASGNAASFTKTSGLYANRAYQFRVQGRNSSGASAWSGPSAVIYMTPAAPSSVSATRVAAGIRVAVGSMPPHATHFDVYDEATGSVVGSVIPRASFPWTHSSPDPAVPHRYRVRARQNSGGVNSTTLISAYSSYSNTVQLQAPPTAATNLSPNGGVVAAEASVRYSWRHNPVDSSEQSEYQLRYRPVGGAWTTLTGATSDEYRDLSLTAPGSYEWEVRTRGAHATYGPYSATATVTVISVPTVAIITPDDGIWAEPTLTAAWSYDQGEGRPQTGWRVQLTDVDAGEVLVDETGTGSASSFPLPVRLVRSTHYRLRVWVANSGIWSDYDELSFETVFVPPAAPIVDAVWNEESGSHDLTVDSSVGPEREDIVNLFTNPRLKGDGTWAEVRRNLYTDPSFEVSVVGWTFQQAVGGTRSSEWASSGEYSLKVEATGEASASTAYRNLASLGAEVGKTYTVLVKQYLPAPLTGDLNARALTVSFAGIPGVGGDNTPGERWLRYTFTVDGVSITTSSLLALYNGSAVEGEAVYYDDFMFVEGEYDGPYFDGSTTPETAVDVVQPEDFRWRWTGAENASESVMEIEQVRGLTAVRSVAGVSTWNGKPATRIIATDPAATGYATFLLPEGPVRDRGTLIATRDSEGPLRQYALRVDSPTTNTGTPGPALRVDERLSFGPLTGTYRVYMYSQGLAGEGDVWWTDIGLFAGEYDGSYFDGSSGQFRIDGTAMNAAWDGEPDNSTSRLTMAEPTVRTAIERSIDGGETWEMVTESPYVDGELSVSDFEGLTMGTTMYRVTGYSVADEAAEVDVSVEASSGAIRVGAGDGFSTVAVLPAQPKVNVSRGRERAAVPYWGRANPVAYASPARPLTVSFTGRVTDEPIPGVLTSTRDVLEQVVDNPYPVHCYRDHRGHRVYGTLSLIGLTDIATRRDEQGGGVWDYSLSITETSK